MTAFNPDAAPNVPPDMRTAAVGLHEYFTTMVDAGFTASQALYLTAALAAGGPKPPPEPPA